MRGLLNWSAPIWAQMLVAGASLLVAVMRVTVSFQRRGVLDICLLLGAEAMLILVAPLGLGRGHGIRNVWRDTHWHWIEASLVLSATSASSGRRPWCLQ